MRGVREGGARPRSLSLVATYSDPAPSFATTIVLEGPRVQKQNKQPQLVGVLKRTGRSYAAF